MPPYLEQLFAFGCADRDSRDWILMVADMFGVWLESDNFTGVFDRVVFGVWDRSISEPVFVAFNDRFR